MFPDDSWQILRRPNTQLLMDTVPTEYDLYITWLYAKFFCEEAHHLVGRPAGYRHGSYTDIELVPFDLADNIPICPGFTEDIQNERITVPRTE